MKVLYIREDPLHIIEVMIVVNRINWIVEILLFKLSRFNLGKVVLIVNIINWVSQVLQVCKFSFQILELVASHFKVITWSSQRFQIRYMFFNLRELVTTINIVDWPL